MHEMYIWKGKEKGWRTKCVNKCGICDIVIYDVFHSMSTCFPRVQNKVVNHRLNDHVLAV